MKDFGRIIFIMEEASFIMQVEICMKENLLMIWHKDLVFIDMLMEVSMLDTGIKINSMALERKNGMMEVNIKAFIKMLLRKAKVNIVGLMVIDILENGKTIC
jgi:hypothetical protein